MPIDFMQYWYRKSLHPLTILLLPFSWLFAGAVALRRYFFRRGIFKTHFFSAPVIVVGNIAIGGTGKTPFVIALVKLLRQQGFRPGIVSRGVGGRQRARPHRVKPSDRAAEVGDEALLLLQNTDCPMVIGIDRVAAVKMLLSQSDCNIVISDDGLQHYHLGRQIEIVMVDGDRRFGNQCLLPAGPLREPLSRLKQVDMVVINGGKADDEFTLQLEPAEFVSVNNPQHAINVSEMMRGPVHAVAGIGNPDRFFNALTALGFDSIQHRFPDHYLYQAQDVDFKDNLPVLMTEKDAVKCKNMVDERYWYLRITAKMNTGLEQAILTKLTSLEAGDENKDPFARTTCSSINCMQHDDIRR